MPYKKDTGVVVKENEEINIESQVEAYYRTRESDSELIDLTNTDTFRSKYIQANKSRDKNVVNPGDLINYKINLKASEYYGYQNLVITDVLPNGLSFQDSETPTELITENIDGTTTIIWKLSNLEPQDNFSINYSTKLYPFV